MARTHGVIQIEKVYRSLPLWLAREYLESIGGRVVREDLVQGDAWHVELHDAPDFEIGALRVGQIRVVFQADAESIHNVIAAFEKKALRAGG
ncbi:MAG: hypothetical protein HY741_23905 [Chloroflexi bacterium]|nr:hypothetical protein [Chloroflexota bacterium]